MAGWIKIYTGPMFSRKTEELMVEMHRYQIAKKEVKLFKHSLDTRYGDDIVSHDGHSMPATKVSSPAEILVLSTNVDVIGIDEAQFFDGKIVDAVQQLADQGKRVVIAGLDKDYLGRPFGPMPYLLAIADEVVKLTAVCSVCGAPATFTVRLSKSSEEVLVGGVGVYEPRCRSHRQAG
ncbi:MAG: thymidine kinase [Thermoprotei archaeon]|jgi:thymidine kinase